MSCYMILHYIIGCPAGGKKARAGGARRLASQFAATSLAVRVFMQIEGTLRCVV